MTLNPWRTMRSSVYCAVVIAEIGSVHTGSAAGRSLWRISKSLLISAYAGSRFGHCWRKRPMFLMPGDGDASGTGTAADDSCPKTTAGTSTTTIAVRRNAFIDLPHRKKTHNG